MRRVVVLVLCAVMTCSCGAGLFLDPPGKPGKVTGRSYKAARCSGRAGHRTCTDTEYVVKVTTSGKERRIRVSEPTFWACPKDSRWPDCRPA